MAQSFVPFIPIFVLFGLAVCTIAWHSWEFWIRTLFIPKSEIKAIARKLVAENGFRAAEFAFEMEERAWCDSNIFEQGKWRRVRRTIEVLGVSGRKI